MIEYQVLGPLQIIRSGQEVSVTTLQLRRMLALFLAEANRPVHVDTLIDSLWADATPLTARKTLQVYVHRLRQLLGEADRLTHSNRRYTLHVPLDSLDSHRFDRLTTETARAKSQGDLVRAAELAVQALSLWRGTAYADLHDIPAIAAESARLEGKRLATLEDRIDIELDRGRHSAIIEELFTAIATHPYQERLRGQLMIALYRCGRQAEALETFRQTQQLLAEELGIEPTPYLQELHQRILRGDTTLTLASVSDRPRSLPPDVHDFVGRRHEFEWLDTAVGSHSQLALVTTISGLGGVGKTALVVRWGYRSAKQFNDGQLYVNLRGYGPGQPMSPAEALSSLLRMLGIPPEQIPHHEQQASALYRSTLAGKRLLILLDNAATAEQVRPLIPGGHETMVVVTSRDRLSGLIARDGARRLTLGVLTATESVQLLVEMLGEEVINADLEAADKLARACGYLPLALRIAAARLADQPDGSLARLAANLSEGDRLAELAVDDDPLSTIQHVFENSYLALADSPRVVFTMLGLYPGTHFTAEVVAALADMSVSEVRRSLQQLHDANLVESPDATRFTLHDLLRVYARKLADTEIEPERRAAAIARLHRFYLSKTDSAARLLGPQLLRLPITITPETPFAGDTEATAWMEAEYSNIIAAIDLHLEQGQVQEASWLGDALRPFLFLRLETGVWAAMARKLLAAAEGAQREQLMVSALVSLAQALHCTGDYPSAIRAYEPALALSRKIGWKHAEATCLGNLGVLCFGLGWLVSAIEYLEQSIDIFDTPEHSMRKAVSIGNLGAAHLYAGNLDQAHERLTEAVSAHRQHGLQGMLVMSMAHLGETKRQLGRTDEAREDLDAATALATRIGSPGGAVEASVYLSLLEADLGHLDRAEWHADQALTIARDKHYTFGLAQSLASQGNIRLQQGRLDEAAAAFDEALAVSRQSNERYPETIALLGLARMHLQAGRPAQAADAAKSALTLAREHGFSLLQPMAQHLLSASG